MALVLLVLSGGVTTGIAAIAGYLVDALGSSGRIPAYLTVLAAGIASILGAYASWRVTRAYYDLKLRSQSKEFKLEGEKRGLELKLVTQQLTSLETDREGLRRLGVYLDHISNLLTSTVSGELSFHDLGSKQASIYVCQTPERQLQESLNCEVTVSIWVEEQQGAFRDRVLPDVVSDRLTRFQLVAAPSLKKLEADDFAVRVDPSWLKHNHRVEQEHGKPHVYSADQLELLKHQGDDLDAFRNHRYRSVRAVSFRREGVAGWLVVLARDSLAFSRIEERYLLSLAQVLELDEAIRGSATVARRR